MMTKMIKMRRDKRLTNLKPLLHSEVDNRSKGVKVPRPYYTTDTAAEKLGVGEQWLRKLLRQGYIPYYKFGRQRLIDVEGLKVAQRYTRYYKSYKPFPDEFKPVHKKPLDGFDGYSLEQAAELTGKSLGQLHTLCREERIPCEQHGGQWIVFDLEKIREVRPRYTIDTENIQGAEYKSSKNETEYIPPLTDAEKRIIELRDNSDVYMSLEAIGRELGGLTRQRVSKLYKRAKDKEKRLKEKGLDVNGNRIGSNQDNAE